MLVCWRPSASDCGTTPSLSATADGQLSLLQGLREFREHLGGELHVTLLRGIGQSFEVTEMDEALVATRSRSWPRAAPAIARRGECIAARPTVDERRRAISPHLLFQHSHGGKMAQVDQRALWRRRCPRVRARSAVRRAVRRSVCVCPPQAAETLEEPGDPGGLPRVPRAGRLLRPDHQRVSVRRLSRRSA